MIMVPFPAGTTVSNPISGHSNPMKRRIVETIAHFTSPMDQVEAGGQEALIFLQQENHHLHLRIQVVFSPGLHSLPIPKLDFNA